MIGKLIFLVMISTTENHSTTTEDGPGAKKRQRYDEFLYDRKEKKIKGLGFLLISGLLFLAIALFYMSKFYKIYQR